MKHHCFLFEARSIQEYLFQSGRLRDVIGASELVDSLTGELLDDVLAALDFFEGRDLSFSRRAGGAFYAFSTDADVLERLAALWTLTVQQYAPGMAYDIGLSREAATHLAAFDNTKKAIQQDAARNRSPLPVASPVTQRSRRTGLAATGLDHDGTPVDAAALRKRLFADLSRANFIERFSPPEAQLRWLDWPRNLEADDDGAFPFLEDDRTLALIHADGNGLGQLLMRARNTVEQRPDEFLTLFRTLSQGIAASTKRAAQRATDEVLLPQRLDGLMPARPILLGGDDLTILVRGDLGLPFVRAFASAFEQESRTAMEELTKLGVTDLPQRLTIGAGLVWMGANQPFYLASSLAESLMDTAKTRAKAHSTADPPSAVAFYRVTSSLVDDYEFIIDQEHSHEHGGQTLIDTASPYLLGTSDAGPRLDDLLDLQALLQQEGMARGPMRQLLTLLGLDPMQAKTVYRRWRRLMQEHRPDQLRHFDTLLGKLVDKPEEALPFGYPLDRTADESTRVSPLGDAVALLAVRNQLPPRRNTQPENDS